jgi:hypothetical protein
MTIVCAQFDPASHKLTTRVFERFNWVDTRLKWDPASYEGIKKVSAPSKLLWRPDIRLQNAVSHSEERDEVNSVFLSDGAVYWIPPATYKTLCSSSDNEDDHSFHCRITLGTWTYDGRSLPLELFADGVDTKMYLKECPYRVKNAKAVVKHTKYDCCPEPYDSIEVTFDIEENKDKDHKDDDQSHADEKDGHKVAHKVDYSKCRWPHCD